MTEGPYRVWRWSGRRLDPRRIVHQGRSRDEAERRYAREAARLRQGELTLEHGSQVLRRVTAPTLRTRS